MEISVDTKLEALFKRFQDDIIYRPETLTIRVDRSLAGREIVLKGHQIIEDIAQHLKDFEPPPTEYPELQKDVLEGWCMIITSLCQTHGIDGVPPGFGDNPTKDLKLWQEWVKLY